MANLNLSEFTEKLFVTDADHTFIWDTLGAISKRVSRNSWLNSGTLTSDAPVTISQTWGNNLATFKALVVNAAGTSNANSASGSLLADFQVGGVSQFRVHKEGGVALNNLMAIGGISGPWFMVYNGSTPSGYAFAVNVAGRLSMPSTGTLEWASFASGSPNLVLTRDGDNTLALRNGALAQTFRVYGSYPDTGINYARLALSCDTSGNATISTQALGTFTAGTVSINGVPVGLGKLNIPDSVAIGTGALRPAGAGPGQGNVAIGYAALTAGNAQRFNVAVGGYALAANNGDNNTAIGIQALWQKTTGARDTAIGSFAGTFFAGGTGNNNVTSNNSVFIGADTKPLADNQTNQIVIGYDATGLGSNTAVLGNSSITTTALRGNVGIGTTAPGSKLDIEGSTRLGGVANIDRTAGTLANLISLQARGAAEASNFGNPLGNGAGEISENGLSGLIIGTRSTASLVLGTSNTERMRILAVSGNIAIGATAAASKLTVTSGDVEVATIASGLILKSPDGTRYRITVPNGGTVLTITAV